MNWSLLFQSTTKELQKDKILRQKLGFVNGGHEGSKHPNLINCSFQTVVGEDVR